MKFGIVNRSDSKIFNYQGWPTVCRDEDGTLYVVCSGHRIGHICPFGKNLMYKSVDEGETWSAPSIINDTALDDRDGGIISLGGGKLIMTYFNNPKEWFYDERWWLHTCKDKAMHSLARGAVESWKAMPEEKLVPGSYIRKSTDGGTTWGEALKMPVSAPHGPVKLRDGRLLYVGTPFCFDGYEPGRLYVMESLDEGETWNKISTIEKPSAEDHNFCEPHCIELPNGRIFAAIRTQPTSDHLDIRLSGCFSDDGGHSWSLPEPLGIFGAPPHLMLHSSGAVVLTYGRRLAPFGERARISYDNCLTFGEEIIISREAKDHDMGYPSTVELSDKSLLTVYYQKLPEDDFCSILYTRWDLP